MELTSLSFFIFLAIMLVFFYLLKTRQKLILMLGSILFYTYVFNGNPIKLCLLILYIGLLTYVGALLIDRTKGKIKSLILSACIIGVVAALIVLKYVFNMLNVIKVLFDCSGDFSALHFVGIIGLSYYSLTAIGYLIGVYWGNYKAEKNIVDIFLFIFYFPQIISGPITRFEEMHVKFNQIHDLSYDNITLGMRRMAFGYFKKLVISERFGVIVSTIYTNYDCYSMVEIILATLCYAVQLYADFSGCMDIIMGASMMFGIELPENFEAPFFSESISEFWRRWHITLGTWFKDYLMYPLQKSKFVQKIGKWSKKKFGKKIGKKVPFHLSMIILWILIGIWHGGTGYYFIASAVVPCTLLIVSDICQPLFEKNRKNLVFKEKNVRKIFRRIRTILLVCICWLFVCSNDTFRAFRVIGHMFTYPIRTVYSMSVFEAFGLGIIDIILMIVGLVVLYVSDKYVYEGTSVFEVNDKKKYWFKVGLIYLELLAIMLWGKLGSSSFIYFEF